MGEAMKPAERRARRRAALWICVSFVVAAGLTAGAAAVPNLQWLGFVLGFLCVLAVPTAIRLTLDEGNAVWFIAFACCALTMMGALWLPPELSLSQNAERVRARVADHETFHTNVGGSRNERHRYVLRRLDGSPLGDPLVEDDPIPGYRIGRTVPVLVDTALGGEPRPASDPPEPGAFVTVLVVGVLGFSAMMFRVLTKARRDVS